MRLSPLVLALAVVLAGCTTKDDSKANDQQLEDLFETATVGSGKGLIRGIVVDPALTPVADATVTLVNTADKTTDENGLFLFADVEPGTYFLQVAKAGWTSVQQSVDVQADIADPPIVKVAITRVPGSEPRAETLSQDGYISCSIGTYVNFIDCATIEEQHSRVYFPITGEPSWVQTELTWESTQATGEWLYVVNGVCGCGENEVPDVGPDRFDETNNAVSPYVTHADTAFLADHREAGMVVLDASASGPEPETTNGSGIALNQRFTAYATFFYNLEPMEGWTFVGDGPYPVPG
ncbi:MAG: Carboxypeptidase regulatory-like domain [Thermoplasmata archaeon]|jgi:hypothetical protein|nr:Carboxypeptidase regulatory-like domain [Thermoplasmata archaeon]